MTDDVTNQEQLKQDARIALLEHYSSKSTNQTIIILTIALVFFTFLGVLPSDFPSRDYFLIIAFGGMLWLAVRAVGRLNYWSEHSDAILYIDALNESDIEKLLERKRETLGLTEKIPWDDHEYPLRLSSNYLIRLSFAAALYLIARRKKQGSKLVKFSDFTRSLWWIVGTVGITILFEGILLGAKNIK